MNLDKINNKLAFYFEWANSKIDQKKFSDMEKKLASVTKEFFLELTSNQKFISWMYLHYYFNDSKDYISTMAEVGANMIKNAKSKLMNFENEKQFESYIFKSMKGNANERMTEGKRIPDILLDRTKKSEENKKKILTIDKSSIDELDNGINKVKNEIQVTENTILEPTLDDDGYELFDSYISIENISDPTEVDQNELNELRTDISLFYDTVAYILWLIHRDLSEDDIVLERKIAWQIETNYDVLLKEKIGLFTDPILVEQDITALIRYEHWQTVKEL